MEMKWYTVYTKPNSEKKVTSILSRKKITHFCPIIFAGKQHEKIKNKDNFSNYVFVKLYESQIEETKQINGIKSFLFWKNVPAIVSEFEINLMKRFLTEHVNVTIEKKEVGFNADILTNSLPQKENEAKLIYLNNNNIKAALPSLGFMMLADFEKPVPRISSDEKSFSNLIPKLKYRLAK